MLSDIHAELKRLQIHPVNLQVSADGAEKIRLSGSLLPYWAVLQPIDPEWLLSGLKRLPIGAGPQTTMNALFTTSGKEATPHA
jgi:hypothetical protein